MNPIVLMQQVASSGSTSQRGNYTYIIMMVALLGVMYFLMIRPQKKRQKEEQELRNSIEIGDEIITIGGISGKVITIRENEVIIETGSDRTKLKMQRWAIQQNVTKTEQHNKELAAAREAAKEKKNKKSGKED